MEGNDTQWKRLIYELMIGVRDSDHSIKECKEIVNEFGDGMFCTNAYEQVYTANQRICKKLKTIEDEDVECMISNLLNIAEYLSMKMYDYGKFYAMKEMDDITE